MSVWPRFWGEYHDIAVCACVHGILVTKYVITSVVNPKNLGRVDFVEDVDSVAIFWGEGIFISVVGMTEKTTE